MNYTDSITKKFLTGSGQFGPTVDKESIGLTRWTNYDDPIYMGFYFKFNPYTIADPDNQDLDYLPQGLFLGAKDFRYASSGPEGQINEDNNHPDSAVNFLARRGEYYRSSMMKEFRDGMMEVSEKTPWVFEKVTGLADLWKIDPKNPWRTKDKKIVLECNEGIGMKMTYLIDLYRKASYDYAYMRYMLPETQRYFSMYLYVMEIRTMMNRGALWNPGFLRFKLDYCEFDFFSEAPGYLDNLARYAGEGSNIKMTIKVGKVTEINQYNVMGAILQDTDFGVYYRGKENARNNFSSDTSVEGATGEKLTSPVTDYIAITNTDYQSGYAQKEANSGLGNRPGQMNPDFPLDWTNQIPAVQRPPDLGPVATGALSYAQNALENVVNANLLGNVYGVSVANVIGQIQGILSNPFVAAQDLISNFTANQQQTNAILNNVNLSGPDVQLITDAIGALEAIQPSVNLENITVGDFISNSPAASELLAGNPGTQPLQAPTIVPSALGKETLSFPQQKNVNLGKETFESPNILSSTLGKILFEGNITSGGSASKVTLSAPPSALNSQTGKELLSGPPSALDLETGKQSLSGPRISQANPGEESLLGNPSNLEGNNGVEELTGPIVELEKFIGREKLEIPPTPNAELGNINLQ